MLDKPVAGSAAGRCKVRLGIFRSGAGSLSSPKSDSGEADIRTCIDRAMTLAIVEGNGALLRLGRVVWRLEWPSEIRSELRISILFRWQRHDALSHGHPSIYSADSSPATATDRPGSSNLITDADTNLESGI
jgi:hypothetical protein